MLGGWVVFDLRLDFDGVGAETATLGDVEEGHFDLFGVLLGVFGKF